MAHEHRTMKLSLLLPNSWANSFRSPSSAPLDGGTAPSNSPFLRSPTALFWFVVHALCCIVSLALNFRFSRLFFVLLFASSSSFNAVLTTPSPPTAATVAAPNSIASCVVVDCHGILVHPWPHPDPDQEIAVKKLSCESQQWMREFTNKVRLLLKIQHHNLVSLLDCCTSIGQKMLIYSCPTSPAVALITSSLVRLSLARVRGRGDEGEGPRAGKEGTEEVTAQEKKRAKRDDDGVYFYLFINY